MVLFTTDGLYIDGKITKNPFVREINAIFNIKILMIKDWTVSDINISYFLFFKQIYIVSYSFH